MVCLAYYSTIKVMFTIPLVQQFTISGSHHVPKGNGYSSYFQTFFSFFRKKFEINWKFIQNEEHRKNSPFSHLFI